MSINSMHLRPFIDKNDMLTRTEFSKPSQIREFQISGMVKWFNSYFEAINFDKMGSPL